eukprot:jgi/Psemu1/44302/gm1.44302_g
MPSWTPYLTKTPPWERPDPACDRLAPGALKPTLLFICDQEFNRPDKIKHQELFGVITKEEYYMILLLGFWPDLMLILTQHLIGGAFTLPAVPAVLCWDGYPPSTASSLACLLGILIEMGWELQDLFRMTYFCLFRGKEGETYLTCCMTLPMVLRYRTLPELHCTPVLQSTIFGGPGGIRAGIHLALGRDPKEPRFAKFAGKLIEHEHELLLPLSPEDRACYPYPPPKLRPRIAGCRRRYDNGTRCRYRHPLAFPLVLGSPHRVERRNTFHFHYFRHHHHHHHRLSASRSWSRSWSAAATATAVASSSSPPPPPIDGGAGRSSLTSKERSGAAANNKRD